MAGSRKELAAMVDAPTPPAPATGAPPAPATGPTPTAPAATPPEPELGEAGIKALETERAARKAAESRLKELEPLAAKAQQLEDANKTEAQRQAEALAEATKQREEAESSARRFQVAAEKGVPADLISFLPSGTKEEIEAAADTLLSRIGEQGQQPRPPAPVLQQGVAGTQTATAQPRDEFARFLEQQLGG